MAALSAQPSNRVFLGELKVDFRVDHDTLVVGAAEGTFRRIQIEAEGNDIQILDLDVVFGNGMRQDVSVRHIFREGSRSRVIDLRGGARVIRSIKVKYRTVRFLTCDCWSRRFLLASQVGMTPWEYAGSE